MKIQFIKLCISMIAFLSFSLAVSSQTLFVKRQYCPKKSIEFSSGTCIPEGFVIVGVGSFEKKNENNSLNSLNEKDKRMIRRYGKMFKSCHVFIDFSGEVIKQNNPSTEHISFYALQPAFKID